MELTSRAGELTTEELERVVTILQNPTQYKIPEWFLNRQKDIVDGKNSQLLANALDNKLREDLERLKKIRAHRGVRHSFVTPPLSAPSPLCGAARLPDVMWDVLTLELES